MDDIAHGESDEVRLPEDLPVDPHALGQRGLERIEHCVDLIRDGQRVGARCLEHRHHDSGKPRVRTRATPGGRAKPNFSNLPDRDRGAIVILDDGARDVLNRADASALADRQLQAVHIRKIPGAERAVRLIRGGDDIVDAQVVQTQLLLLDKDLILGELAADDRDLCNTGDRKELVTKVILGIGTQFHGWNAGIGRGHSQEHDLACDAGDGRHLGVRVGRQVLTHGVEPLRNELSGAVDVHAPVKLDIRDGEPDGAGGANTTHTRDPVDGGLDREGHILLHFVGGEPRGFGHDDDGGGVEFGEHIDRCLGKPERGERKQDHGQHEHECGVVERELDQFFQHDVSLPLVFVVV